MAEHRTVELIDDLDGSPGSTTVRFGIDGHEYEIDLNAHNADALLALFDPYIAHARRVYEPSRRAQKRMARPRRHREPANAPEPPFQPVTEPPATSGRRLGQLTKEQRTQIRMWAQGQGLPVGDTGRIPQAVVDRYFDENRDGLDA